MQLHGKHAVVTGGTSGIGLALTRALRAEGAHVLVIGRDAAKLSAVSGEDTQIATLRADLRNAAEREHVVSDVLAGERAVDILINNAGTMQFFDLRDADAMHRLDNELALDLIAPVHFSTALLHHLIGRPRAALVNITTGLIYAPSAGSPGYSAAKNGLHGFTLSLRHQVRNTALTVLEVMPPTVDTNLNKEFRTKKISPERVANSIIDALKKDKHELRIGQSKALYGVSRVAPTVLFRALNKIIERSATAGKA